MKEMCCIPCLRSVLKWQRFLVRSLLRRKLWLKYNIMGQSPVLGAGELLTNYRVNPLKRKDYRHLGCDWS
jgi:hypothetical protein